MAKSALDVVEQAFDGFNRGDPKRVAAVMAADATIVPLRAAMEDTVYSGPHAAHEFWSDTQAAWTEVEIELQERRELDSSRVLVLGMLRGRGRETGAEVATRAGWLVSMRGDRIADITTYASWEAALEAAGQDR